MNEKYNPDNIEKKWQQFWREQGTFQQYERKEKFYTLDMFPYPSGAGLHVGHPKGYIATDVLARMKQLQGYGVLHPMGWDAFGLPAEQFALKNKTHPRISTEENIQNYKRQLGAIGFTYDWDREINTTDPAYYKWTQWIFLQMWKKGLAYESHEPINWCPSCKTGLANEDLEQGKCERCGSEVEKRPLRQWVLKMTNYAERLLADLDMSELNWPEEIKNSQRNWIGKSEGAEIDFSIVGSDKKISVFTTRPDTLFGVTYMVLAPEHSLVMDLQGSIENWEEVAVYREEAKKKSEIERTNATKEKTGVELIGIRAINPGSKTEIPVYVADYVLAGYGTGAIMAVPAHDERDNEFAKKFHLPIQQVILPVYNAFPGEKLERRAVYALITNQKNEHLIQYYEIAKYHWPVGGGMDEGETEEECLRREIIEETGYTDFVIKERLGEVAYENIRESDGTFRRTIGAIYDVELLSERQIPTKFEQDEIADGLTSVWVTGEDLEKELSRGQENRSAFVRHGLNLKKSKVSTTPGVLINSGEFDDVSSEEAKLSITESVGGKMTTTYRMRDWTFSRQRYWGEPIPLIHCEKCGVVGVPESELPVILPEVDSYEPNDSGESPLANITEWVKVECPECGGPGRRETNTMPQWAGSCWYYLRYIDPKNIEALVDKNQEKKMMPVDVYVGGAEHATRHLLYARFWHKFLFDIGAVSTQEPFTKLVNVGLILASDGRKMSKRWGNVINPDDMVREFGADAFRLYEMFMGPFNQAIAWNTNGLTGTRRFLEKVWKVSQKIDDTENQEVESLLQETIKKVTEDIEEFRFNTAVSQLMIFVNALPGKISRSALERFLLLLSPFAPHVAEELWAELGQKESIFLSSWPTLDAEKIVTDSIKMAVQVNGKVRAVIEVTKDMTDAEIQALALAEEKVQVAIGDKEIKKVIIVPQKIVSIVV